MKHSDPNNELLDTGDFNDIVLSSRKPTYSGGLSWILAGIAGVVTVLTIIGCTQL